MGVPVYAGDRGLPSTRTLSVSYLLHPLPGTLPVFVPPPSRGIGVFGGAPIGLQRLSGHRSTRVLLCTRHVLAGHAWCSPRPRACLGSPCSCWPEQTCCLTLHCTEVSSNVGTLMTIAVEKGKASIDLDGQAYLIQYELTELREGWFTLTIWHSGRSVTERVPSYTTNAHDDVKSPHGGVLLKRLLSETRA